jgi:hypothetical protein
MMMGGVGHDEMGADLHVGDTHIYSEQTGNENDFTESNPKAKKQMSKKETEQIVKQFRVLYLNDVMEMLQ